MKHEYRNSDLNGVPVHAEPIHERGDFTVFKASTGRLGRQKEYFAVNGVTGEVFDISSPSSAPLSQRNIDLCLSNLISAQQGFYAGHPLEDPLDVSRRRTSAGAFYSSERDIVRLDTGGRNHIATDYLRRSLIKGQSRHASWLTNISLVLTVLLIVGIALYRAGIVQ